MKIYVYGKSSQQEMFPQIAQMTSFLASSGAEVVADGHLCKRMDAATISSLRVCDIVSTPPAGLDAAISIGGDGAFLRAAGKLAATGTPIVGINTGHLGFLTAADSSQMLDVAARLLNGDYTVEHRTMLQASHEDGTPLTQNLALNEVAFLRQDISSLITIDVEVDGHWLTSYRADGLIVATPTGSTAYNLSCGGPIIAPNAAAIVLTPVSPHSLTMRPLVLADNARLRVTTHSRARSYQLSIDGRTALCHEGSSILISKAPSGINVIHTGNHSFPQSLADKLLWGKDPR